jgi:hypothetical protein
VSSYQAARCGGIARHKPVMRREGLAPGRSPTSGRSQAAARGPGGVSGGRGWQYTIPASAVVGPLVPAIAAARALGDHGTPCTASLILSADGSTLEMDRLWAGCGRSARLSLRNVLLASGSCPALFGRGRPPLCFNTDTCAFCSGRPTSSGSYRLRTIVYPNRGGNHDDYSERLHVRACRRLPTAVDQVGRRPGAELAASSSERYNVRASRALQASKWHQPTLRATSQTARSTTRRRCGSRGRARDRAVMDRNGNLSKPVSVYFIYGRRHDEKIWGWIAQANLRHPEEGRR